MRIYKQMYKSRKGEYKQAKKWYVETRDHKEIVRAFPAFTDRKQSEVLANKIENW